MSDYLVKPMETLPATTKAALGIHQSDIILRTAILAGIADLRANPKLLDYVFASLPRDPLTFREYGEEQVALAKKWFLSQDFPVFMNTRVDESKIPCITIALQGSAESAATLGDVHYQIEEDDSNTSPIVYYGPFTPTYAPTTGTITTPEALDVFPGMLFQDNTGATYEIQDVLDPYTFTIEPNTMLDVRDGKIVSAYKRTVTLESLEFRETFEIGCHAVSEPVYLTYLHSILIFILLRYKENLLESRGLERTTVTSGPVVLNTAFATSQPVFTRMVTLVGFVRQYWPKHVQNPVEGVVIDPYEVVQANSDDVAVEIFTPEES